MNTWMNNSWRQYCEDGDGPLGWFLVAALVVLIVVLGCALSGCAVLGERPQVAVSLDADRQLAAAARRDVEVVLAGARAGEHQATARLLEDAVQGLSVLQAGPIGSVTASPWPPEIVERVAAELRCEPVVRIEADPAVAAALKVKTDELAAVSARSETVHGQLQAAEATIKSRWSGEAVAGALVGVGGPLGLLLAGLWRNRRTIQAAAERATMVLQEVKGERKIGEVVDRHAPPGSPERRVLDDLHARVKRLEQGESEPDLRERSMAALMTLKTKLGKKIERKKQPKS